MKPLGLFFLGDETFGHKMPVKTGLKVGNYRHGPTRWIFWCAVALWPRHGGPFGLLRLQQWNGWSLDGMFVSIRSTSIYLCNLYIYIYIAKRVSVVQGCVIPRSSYMACIWLKATGQEVIHLDVEDFIACCVTATH